MNLGEKNVYLSGAMTGHQYNNIDAFARAYAIVREHGAKTIYDPAFAWAQQPLDEDKKHDHAYYMLKCLGELTRKAYCGDDGAFYDVLLSLPGWDNSEGAVMERAVAEACGILCLDLEEVMAADDER